MLRIPSYLTGFAAAVLGCASAAAFLGVLAEASLTTALLLHAIAVALTCTAAVMRGARRGVDLDTVLVIAVFVPVVGPALGWTFPAPKTDDSATNAHAVFERYEEATRGDKPSYRPAIFTGNFDRDLSREINTVSYAEVLRRGELEQKRNLLRTLGRRAGPRHLEMIRKCLYDDEHEIRLCAFAEIDRLSRRHEADIAKLKSDLDNADPTAAGAEKPLIVLAQAQLDYACSGIMDGEMAQFWLAEGRKTAARALEIAPGDWQATTIKARCHAECKEYEAAIECLDRVADHDRQRPEIGLARAEIAFHRRDYAVARTEARKLRARRLQLPPWLAALGEPRAPDPEELSWKN